jgi:hypothetical protein
VTESVRRGIPVNVKVVNRAAVHAKEP